MQDKAISDFLESKKQDFLKKHVKGTSSDEEQHQYLLDAEERFSLTNWLLDASNRAGQLSLTSHPAKFIHPNAKVSSILADTMKRADGLLRSGNVQVELDVFGNAAALDVEKFLRVILQDGNTILHHLEQHTPYIQEQFSIQGVDYASIRDNFLKIKQSGVQQTSEKIKQVYFPVGDDYHLLSILNPSGVIYKLKERINALRFSDSNKALREEMKKAKPSSMQGKIEDIFGLAAIGYGGTKPQNISTLNNQNGGVSLALLSLPPTLEKRKLQPPKTDFFENCLWSGLFQHDFDAFHQVLVWRKNNKDIREMRDDIVLNAMSRLQRLVARIRDIPAGWSDSESYNGLLHWQKIWLDEKYTQIRHDKMQNADYINQVQSYFSHWFIGQYKLTIKDNKLLGDDDIEHIKQVLGNEREVLQ